MTQGRADQAPRIERAEIGDAEQILSLQRLAYQSEARLYSEPNLPPLRQTLAELTVEFATHIILKAILNQTLVGSVRANQTRSICLIGRLMVDPQLQGHGIGTALMRQIEACFPGVKEFRLFTGAKSAANIRLYHRLGYTIVGTEYVNDRVSLVVMTKPV